jgi:hypothetical protein
MKNLFIPKHDGALVVLICTIALLATLGVAYWGSAWQAPATAATPLPTLPDIKVPEEAVMKEMAALRKRLNRLAYPRAAVNQPVELGLFGYTPAAIGLPGNKGNRTGARLPVQFDYTLSFALAAGRRQLCLLDGQLYALGALLPDGGRILAIEPERVLIEKTPLKRWVYLQEARIGGDAPAAARGPEPSTHEEL